MVKGDAEERRVVVEGDFSGLPPIYLAVDMDRTAGVPWALAASMVMLVCCASRREDFFFLFSFCLFRR